MTQDELLKLLENEPKPICQIEQELGMPKTTLQKAVKGERKLPKKWAIALKGKYSPKFEAKAEPDKTLKPKVDVPKTSSNSTNTGGSGLSAWQLEQRMKKLGF